MYSHDRGFTIALSDLERWLEDALDNLWKLMYCSKVMIDLRTVHCLQKLCSTSSCKPCSVPEEEWMQSGLECQMAAWLGRKAGSRGPDFWLPSWRAPIQPAAGDLLYLPASFARFVSAPAALKLACSGSFTDVPSGQETPSLLTAQQSRLLLLSKSVLCFSSSRDARRQGIFGFDVFRKSRIRDTLVARLLPHNVFAIGDRSRSPWVARRLEARIRRSVICCSAQQPQAGTPVLVMYWLAFDRPRRFLYVFRDIDAIHSGSLYE